ncbi:protein arginine N-methyltransferase 5-like [Actinia tenebrosa]|uniref:Protein arginine N-methyltransferase 5 n=1 Tax=Actinia tenebrosa TaxID=6105 RepID=A0A6P8IC82_ACTTE|nr:protein arginine N-methyltransferase 5-like [Actinia tenebrosa]
MADLGRVSCGRDLTCVPDLVVALNSASQSGFDFICAPICHPRYKREFIDPIPQRSKAFTRADLVLTTQDWSTLVVGKVSPWINLDSHNDIVRKNSEKLNVQLILSGCSKHKDKGIGFYYQYLEHVYQTRPALDDVSQFAKGYEDYLQCPLQPLSDNLESQTYEIFERDPVKYAEYQKAVYQALIDRVPDEKKNDIVTVIMVVGAGRGPLVRASLVAGEESGRKVRVYAVEKNPNAVVTLETLKKEEWGDRVTVISCDMRECEPPEKADILVSELLGSFGDNELSPECLDGAQRFLKDDGISIPSAYTSYLSPLCAPKLHNELSQGSKVDNKGPQAPFETPYVVRLHNVYELSKPQECFTFIHPNKETFDNSRYITLNFDVDTSAMIHGFAGYFEATLFKDVKISIHPETHSDGMFSWFPFYFPVQVPMYVDKGSPITVHMWRKCTTKKVWYEWCLSRPSPTPIHNPGGRSYVIGL